MADAMRVPGGAAHTNTENDVLLAALDAVRLCVAAGIQCIGLLRDLHAKIGAVIDADDVATREEISGWIRGV